MAMLSVFILVALSYSQSLVPYEAQPITIENGDLAELEVYMNRFRKAVTNGIFFKNYRVFPQSLLSDLVLSSELQDIVESHVEFCYYPEDDENKVSVNYQTEIGYPFSLDTMKLHFAKSVIEKSFQLLTVDDVENYAPYPEEEQRPVFQPKNKLAAYIISHLSNFFASQQQYCSNQNTSRNEYLLDFLFYQTSHFTPLLYPIQNRYIDNEETRRPESYSNQVKNAILQEINDLREDVYRGKFKQSNRQKFPKSSIKDAELEWNNELQREAQDMIKNCHLYHENMLIYTSQAQISVLDVIKEWARTGIHQSYISVNDVESYDARKNQNAYSFIQLILQTATQVGCVQSEQLQKCPIFKIEYAKQHDSVDEQVLICLFDQRPRHGERIYQS